MINWKYIFFTFYCRNVDSSETPVGFTTTSPGGIVNTEFVDKKYIDAAFADFSKEDSKNTSMVNPLYEDTFADDDETFDNLEQF